MLHTHFRRILGMFTYNMSKARKVQIIPIKRRKYSVYSKDKGIKSNINSSNTEVILMLCTFLVVFENRYIQILLKKWQRIPT